MKRILFNWWSLTIATAVIVALILALALPIFLHALRPWWARLLFVLLVAAVWGAFALLRVLKPRKASDAIARELATPEPGQAEAQDLAKRMADAMGMLRQASGDKRDYLYSRPWYVIIGPPGAGKTTALLNSGLRFPFSETALKGIGGTRNLDFWFADEAAIVDTAGRYTTQDSDAIADSRAWHSFLGLLRKHRPLQPINGVLVAIGLDELMRADRIKLDAHAAAVRRRLAELQRTLEVAAPVYVLFTKADLLAGFTEFYDDLDVEGRRAVLGATLPVGGPISAPNLANEFDLFARSVSARMSKRLHEEPDLRRRALILGFPSQIDALRARVLRFLDGAFLAEGQSQSPLRGFYLASGTQEGAPLDRILSGMASVYDQPQAAPRGQGRAYFLNRLLHEVIIPEAGLVQTDARAEVRRRTRLIGGLASIGVVVVLVLILWMISFVQNRSLQDKLLAGAQNVRQEQQQAGIDLEVGDNSPDLEQSLSVLRALRELPRGYGESHKHGAPLFMTFGLYQGGLAKTAQQAYLEGLRRILLPRVLLRLERYMQDHQSEPLNLYDPLKSYLMLGGQGRLDPKTVAAWVEADWAAFSYPGADREQMRRELAQHLDSLLGDKQMSSVWPRRQAPLNGALIASARSVVQNMSLAERAYAILRQKASTQGAPWQAGEVLRSGDARAFANGDDVLRLSVPFFFTKRGYEQAYLPGLTTVQEDLRKDLWVLGPDADSTAIRGQISGVRPGVAGAYARDYIGAWEAVIKTPLPGDFFRDPTALAAFTRTPSPLKLLLLEVRKNTTFSGGVQGAVGAKLAALPGVGGAVSAGIGEADAGQQIQSYFKPMADYVGDNKAPAPFDDFITSLKTAQRDTAAAAFAGGGAAAGSTQASVAASNAAVQQSAAGAPPQLQAFVVQAVKGGQAAATSVAKDAVASAYQLSLLPFCRAVSDNRYPFFGAAPNEATIADILRVFGPNGQFDSFMRDSLGTLLDTAGPVWRWSATSPIAANLDPVSAEQFHRAAQLRELMTAGLPLKVEAAGFGGAVTAVEFSSGGIAYKFDASSVGSKPVMWSPTGVPEAHVILFGGDKQLKQVPVQGPWALFHLMDTARKENAGPATIKATFGEGAAFATLKITLPSETNPFSRGGVWSFRCPATL